ncbi:putative sulfate/molybdate transporter [Aspergillus lucknowensis]|uniref:Sulfate transporter n=1 Tax=Aspergillus lucknowensis TaxID=176173 RepID=A0ABR4LVJ3_9EURO
MTFPSQIQSITKYNVTTFRRHSVSEIAGSLGDLGTFLPIALALAANGTVSLASTLIFSGLFNILTGLFFGIPLPVQPMKAIAAVAIARSFSPGSIAAAGLFVAVILFVGSVTGLLQWFTRVIPIPVVKGIQVGAGLSLVMAACTTLHSLGWIHPSWADNRLWAIGVFIALLLTNSTAKRLPYALVVFVIGLVLAIIRSALASSLPSFLFWNPYTVVPVGSEWSIGAINAGLGQLPLTTLNSVVAVVHLAADLLPSVPTPSVTSIGLSVSAMNLIGVWFGAMPVCHGSGGLAGQYRFGARSGASVIFLGLVKLVVGLVFGESLVGLLHRFPKALLAVMVIAAGMELVRVGESLNTSGARDLARHAEDVGDSSRFHADEEERTRRWMVMMVTVGLLVGFKNDAVGFVAGMLCHWAYELPALIQRTRRRWSEGRVRLP